MHGQKRNEYKSRLLNPEAATKLATKAQQWNHLSNELLQQRRRLFSNSNAVSSSQSNDEKDKQQKPVSAEMLLSLTEKMLSVNPDPSHLWNIRREMLLYVPITEISNEESLSADVSQSTSSSIPTTSIDIKAELELTAHCLQRNPKSYSSWYHRKWSLVYHLTHPTTTSKPTTDDEIDKNCSQDVHIKQHLDKMKSTLQSELELCAQFLLMDERNFHCWNYRRFVVAILGSCGSSSTTKEEMAIAEKSDREMFNGSWSSWLNQTKVSMGAQLSQNAITAVGSIPSNSTNQVNEHDIAKSILPLTKQELKEIITTEWNFTTSKIQDNFSNGSAFHYRSKLLPLVLETRLSSSSSDDDCSNSSNDAISPSERYSAMLSLARDEWESILLNAVFTEPDDQTPWWYHRFLLSWAEPLAELKEGDELVEEYVGLLFEMADSLRDLLEIEKESDMVSSSEKKKDESKGVKCKWAYIGLHLCLDKLLPWIDEEEAGELREEANTCLTQLIRIDESRKERYLQL